MIKINRIVSLLLALSLLGALLAGCAGSSADRCVKVEGDTISIPSMRISFSFPAPWFVVTDEELDAISQNKDLLNDYVLLLNGKTLETCRISAKEDLNEYSLESFASSLFDRMQEDMEEISLPQTWSIGKYKGYTISAVPTDSPIHYKYYYLHEKSTFVEIITGGYSDHVKAIES